MEWRGEAVTGNVLGAHGGGGAVCPVSERRATCCVGESWCSGAVCSASGSRLAGIGELRWSLKDYVALGHAGRPESGLQEQAPLATAPFLSVYFPGFGWRRQWSGGSLLLVPEPKMLRGSELIMLEDSLPDAPLSVVGSDVTEDGASGSRGTSERASRTR